MKENQSLLLSLDLLAAFVRGVEFQAREAARRFAPSTALRSAYQKQLEGLETIRKHAARLYEAEMDQTFRRRQELSKPELEIFQRLYDVEPCASLSVSHEEMQLLMDLIAAHFLSAETAGREVVSILQSLDHKLNRIAKVEEARPYTKLLDSMEEDRSPSDEHDPPSRPDIQTPSLRILSQSE